jgi:hypothetical protein
VVDSELQAAGAQRCDFRCGGQALCVRAHTRSFSPCLPLDSPLFLVRGCMCVSLRGASVRGPVRVLSPSNKLVLTTHAPLPSLLRLSCAAGSDLRSCSSQTAAGWVCRRSGRAGLTPSSATATSASLGTREATRSLWRATGRPAGFESQAQAAALPHCLLPLRLAK